MTTTVNGNLPPTSISKQMRMPLHESRTMVFDLVILEPSTWQGSQTANRVLHLGVTGNYNQVLFWCAVRGTSMASSLTPRPVVSLCHSPWQPSPDKEVKRIAIFPEGVTRDGQQAQHIATLSLFWQAFRGVSIEPVLDPVLYGMFMALPLPHKPHP